MFNQGVLHFRPTGAGRWGACSYSCPPLALLYTQVMALSVVGPAWHRHDAAVQGGGGVVSLFRGCGCTAGTICPTVAEFFVALVGSGDAVWGRRYFVFIKKNLFCNDLHEDLQTSRLEKTAVCALVRPDPQSDQDAQPRLGLTLTLTLIKQEVLRLFFVGAPGPFCASPPVISAFLKALLSWVDTGDHVSLNHAIR